jgi:8-oxo-dGTP pyrophosphatase MutT (NUDIX family)
MSARVASLYGDDWRARIASNLARASAQRVRALFEEINPHLVGDKRFEARWTRERRDAAVLVPIINRREGPTILFTVRSADMPSHAGQIAFPGGRVHPEDRDAVAAALREAQEEVNIGPDAVEVIGALGAHEGGLGFSVTPVIGVIDPAADIRPCPREVAETFEAPLEFFADLANHRLEFHELEGVRYRMYSAPYERFHIWGLTAGILRSLAETLQGGKAPDV